MSQDANVKLPPLPETSYSLDVAATGDFRLFTPKMMAEYALTAIAQLCAKGDSTPTSLPLTVTFAIDYINGVMECEQAEIQKTWAVIRDYLQTPVAIAKPDSAEQVKLQHMITRLMAMTKWLEENQADVFRRGLWDALNAAPLNTAQQAPDVLTDGAAKRLRLICKLLGLENAIPETDAALWDCAFSVLGIIRSKLDEQTKDSVGILIDTTDGHHFYHHGATNIKIWDTFPDHKASFVYKSSPDVIALQSKLSQAQEEVARLKALIRHDGLAASCQSTGTYRNLPDNAD